MAGRHSRTTGIKGDHLMKKSIPLVVTLAAIAVGVVATSTAIAGSASSATTDRNSKISGASVVAWNQELLKILLTPGAQPATVHPTRSYAILHAAIEAGRATLTALYPGFKGELAQLADSQLATIPDGVDKQDGIQVGDAVAAKILQLPADDGSA